MKYIIVYTLVILSFSCQDKNNSDNSKFDFNFVVHARFDSNYVYLEAQFRNNSNQTLYIPTSNWIFETKSFKEDIFFRRPGMSYVFNSIYFYPESDSLNKNFSRTSKIDFQSINGFIRIKPKESKVINISFNNRRSLNGNCNFFLYKDYNYNLLLNMTILNESYFRLVSDIIVKNEDQLLLDSSSEINYSFGFRNSKHLYFNESNGLSKYNYEEKFELSELFQQNKYIFSLSQVSYSDNDSIQATY